VRSAKEQISSRYNSELLMNYPKKGFLQAESCYKCVRKK